MEQKYPKFKKMFDGDNKLNITAIDFDDNVLAHVAVLAKDNNLQSALDSLHNQLKEKNLLIKVLKYEVVYPTNKVELILET